MNRASKTLLKVPRWRKGLEDKQVLLTSPSEGAALALGLPSDRISDF